jgi:hypothetical protein
MTYKFEKLEIYQLALDYLDLIYALADRRNRLKRRKGETKESYNFMDVPPSNLI